MLLLRLTDSINFPIVSWRRRLRRKTSVTPSLKGALAPGLETCGTQGGQPEQLSGRWIIHKSYRNTLSVKYLVTLLARSVAARVDAARPRDRKVYGTARPVCFAIPGRKGQLRMRSAPMCRLIKWRLVRSSVLPSASASVCCVLKYDSQRKITQVKGFLASPKGQPRNVRRSVSEKVFIRIIEIAKPLVSTASFHQHSTAKGRWNNINSRWQKKNKNPLQDVITKKGRAKRASKARYHRVYNTPVTKQDEILSDKQAFCKLLIAPTVPAGRAEWHQVNCFQHFQHAEPDVLGGWGAVGAITCWFKLFITFIGGFRDKGLQLHKHVGIGNRVNRHKKRVWV